MCKLRHGICCIFFFTKCTVLMATSQSGEELCPGTVGVHVYICIDKMASMVILVFSMVKGSILEVLAGEKS